MMKLKSVPTDLAYTQMQQSWYKPRPTKIDSVPVNECCFCKAKQSETKRDPVTRTLYEARVQATQEYSFEQQQLLKTRLLEYYPTCAFAQILQCTRKFPRRIYQYTIRKHTKKLYFVISNLNPGNKIMDLSHDVDYPALPLNIVENVPCVYNVDTEEQRSQLLKIQLTLDEAHALKQSTRQQSLSYKWQ